MLLFPCALAGLLSSKQVRVDSAQSGKVREQQGCGTEIHGLNLHHGMRVLFDFAIRHGDTIPLLEELVTSLGQIGFKLNTSKTKILTTQP